MTRLQVSPTSARLDTALQKALAEHRIVGAVVLVAQHGEVIYRKAAGFADREARREMRPDMIFRLASIAKPIVTAAAMRFVEEGLLTLDAPVTKWLPNFRPALPDGSRPAITIHHLLTHTSGLGYSFLEPADGPYHQLHISDGLDQPGLSLDENLSRLAVAPLYFKPGSSWRYSLGIDIVGGILEKIDGRGLPEIVREKVTAPLSLQDTGFSVVDLSRLAVPYADGHPEPVRMTDGIAVSLYGLAATFAPSRILDAQSYPSGGAGMAGTADDVLRFLEAIRTGGAPILKAETIKTMTMEHVGPQAETQGPGWGFGYGWAVLVDPAAAGSPQAPGTLQWGGAYGHKWFIDRANGLSVVALTNTTFEGMTGKFTIDIRDAVYG
ncbi:serine hydrolase domain-containing protein [Rhodoligotrophos ferricapiens]|uniref:serine hydrolase domain-containing protein n=1 Tax=Rhodoligotrophos ferricapiens TaxID=3069264 RepID=UPI00315D350A